MPGLLDKGDRTNWGVRPRPHKKTGKGFLYVDPCILKCTLEYTDALFDLLCQRQNFAKNRRKLAAGEFIRLEELACLPLFYDGNA